MEPQIINHGTLGMMWLFRAINQHLKTIFNDNELQPEATIEILNSSKSKIRNYWKWLKNKLNQEGSEVVSIINQLKLKAPDGKLRLTNGAFKNLMYRWLRALEANKVLCSSICKPQDTKDAKQIA